MKPFKHTSDDDSQLSKLESHIKDLPMRKAPETWKHEILSHAQTAIDTKPADAKATGKTHPVDLITILHGFISRCKSGLALITPARGTIAAIWLLALCGNKFDAWLNGTSNPTSEWPPTPSAYITLSTQLEQWELAGLEPDSPKTKPDQTRPSQEPQPETIPGPRSHWNHKKPRGFYL